MGVVPNPMPPLAGRSRTTCFSLPCMMHVNPEVLRRSARRITEQSCEVTSWSPYVEKRSEVGRRHSVLNTIMRKVSLLVLQYTNTPHVAQRTGAVRPAGPVLGISPVFFHVLDLTVRQGRSTKLSGFPGTRLHALASKLYIVPPNLHLPSCHISFLNHFLTAEDWKNSVV